MIRLPLPRDGQNAVGIIRQVLDELRHDEFPELQFSPGRYEFWPEGCTQRYCYFTNNDEGLKCIALDLSGWKNLTLKGNGAELYFHGRISPVVATQCDNLTIEGLTIDFEDSFVSDADVVSIEDDICWLKIAGPHRFDNGILHFTEDVYDNLSGMLTIYSYDAHRRELVWDNRPISVPNRGVLSRDGLIGLPGLAGKLKSDSLIIKHEARLCPGMVFDQCQGVIVKHTTLHHAAGMGILAQLCTDVSLDGVSVTPSTRRTAVSDDAVHFCECRGRLSLEHCLLTGTLDDALNVHGIYRPLKMRVPGGKFYYLDTGHFQQMGLRGARSGDTLELIKNDTYIPYATVKVAAASVINKALTRIVPAGEMPPQWSPGDNARVLEVGEAELTVRNCTMAPLNGRGVLASGLRKVFVEECRFHTPGAAIFVSGDCTYWYESGPVKEMVIQNNLFDNCCHLKNISACEVVSVFPEIQKFSKEFHYHGSFTVQKNHFISNERTLIAVSSAEKLTVRKNDFTVDTTYPYQRPENPAYSFATIESPRVIWQYCGTVELQDDKGFTRSSV